MWHLLGFLAPAWVPGTCLAIRHLLGYLAPGLAEKISAIPANVLHSAQIAEIFSAISGAGPVLTIKTSHFGGLTEKISAKSAENRVYWTLTEIFSAISRIR
jgi:hypothetical protein